MNFSVCVLISVQLVAEFKRFNPSFEAEFTDFKNQINAYLWPNPVWSKTLADWVLKLVSFDVEVAIVAN